jgi:hypothetical protein
MLGGSPLPAIAFDVVQVSVVERWEARSGLHVSEWLEIRYRRSPAEASLRSVVPLVGSPPNPVLIQLIIAAVPRNSAPAVRVSDWG